MATGNYASQIQLLEIPKLKDIEGTVTKRSLSLNSQVEGQGKNDYQATSVAASWKLSS